MFLSFILFIIGAFILRWIFWFLVGVLQIGILMPIITLINKRKATAEGISAKPYIVAGVIMSIIFCTILIFLISGLTYTAIVQAEAFGGWKWLFLIAGLFISLISPPRDEDQSYDAKYTAAFYTSLIVYIVNVCVILFWMLPEINQ